MSREQVGTAVIGAGYWGPNLVRNLQGVEECDLRWVVDLDVTRAQASVGRYSTVRTTDRLDDVLADKDVLAVAIATPPATHFEVALASLDAGKHVLVEKPMAGSVHEAQRLIDASSTKDLVLMCDHTYCYTPAVQKIRDLIATGTLGDILYFDSTRINLGIVQRDISVFWDLAPHDLSILDFVMPERWLPGAVAAHGADPLGVGHPCVGYMTLMLGAGAIGHINVNWLSPTKIRTTVIGGSRRTLVWDDLIPAQRISLFDRGVDLSAVEDVEARKKLFVSYRSGEMVAPALPETEALDAVAREFLSCVRRKRQPATDGEAGLRVLAALEATDQSLRASGTMVPFEVR